MKQEKAIVGAFSVIVQPVVEPMEHYTALEAGAGAGAGKHQSWHEMFHGSMPHSLQSLVRLRRFSG